jgi:CubicO group peptidase (beta-lactamase class C family)
MIAPVQTARAGHSAAAADLDRLLDSLVDEAVPGGVAVVATRDALLYEGAFGLRSLEPTREPASVGTLYDCASLTKPLVVASLAMRLRARGALRFEDPVTSLVPEMAPLPGEARAPTIGELLLHAGGLPAWKPLYALVEGGLPERARWLARHRDEPGQRAVYGCPGYQLLGLALERASGQSLAEMSRRELWPGRDDVVLGLPPARRGEAAPTERGNVFERRLAGEEAASYAGYRTGMIRGEVHDHNAFTVGGFAGNAGLFATARGVASLAQQFLRPDEEFSRDDLDELSRDLAPHAQEGGEQRTWGFQLARSPNSAASDAVDARAFGHCGFTGTSVLVDPSRGAAYVLLTNRVHPEHRERAFHEDRRRFHAAAARVAMALRD